MSSSFLLQCKTNEECYCYSQLYHVEKKYIQIFMTEKLRVWIIFWPIASIWYFVQFCLPLNLVMNIFKLKHRQIVIEDWGIGTVTKYIFPGV